jgi:hypothetical protein
LRVTLICLAFVALGIFVGTLSLRRHAYLEAFVGVGFEFPFLLLLIALQFVARGHTSLRADHDSAGTALRPDRTFNVLVLSTILFMILVLTIFVIFTLTGDLHMFATRRRQAIAVVSACFAVGIGVSGLLTAWRRGGVGYVKLTPTGLEIADIKNTESVAWDAITEVADHSETNKKTRKAIVLRFADGTEKTIDGADFYVPNGVGLYWMVRHYWRHADDRVELTDGRALERLHEGRFDTTVP